MKCMGTPNITFGVRFYCSVLRVWGLLSFLTVVYATIGDGSVFPYVVGSEGLTRLGTHKFVFQIPF